MGSDRPPRPRQLTGGCPQRITGVERTQTSLCSHRMIPMRRLLVLLVAAGAAPLGTALALQAQQAPAAPAPPLRPVTLDSTLLSAYRWRNIGPDRGGRSIAVSGVQGRPDEAYFGAVGDWGPVTDGQVRSASVGAVAVSETNPDIVYIGMGETCIRGNIMPGDGVYRSTDGGKTWTHVGFSESHGIAKIRIHPTNPQIVFVAAFG